MWCCRQHKSSESSEQGTTRSEPKPEARSQDNKFLNIADTSSKTSPDTKQIATSNTSSKTTPQVSNQNKNLIETKTTEVTLKPVVAQTTTGTAKSTTSSVISTSSVSTNANSASHSQNLNSKTPTSMAAPSSQGDRLIKEINQLCEAVDKSVALNEQEAKKASTGYAHQLAILTSQVLKEAGKMSEAVLLNAVARLETVAARLESIAKSQSSKAASQGDSDNIAPFVTAFDDFLGASFAKYLSNSAAIGGDVKTQAGLVESAFRAQRQFLVVASKSKSPSQDVLTKLIKPIADKLAATQEFRENNRKSEFFNQLSAVSESIPALGWITIAPAPGPFVKEMTDAGTFYSNRVLKDYKDKDPKHVDWAKSWIATLTELQEYIKEYHRTGVSWNPQGGDASSSAAGAPPAVGGAPPPPPPPPPPPADTPSGGDSKQDAHAALFADINKGENVTGGLRKVTDDMKTHKNPALRQGPAPFKSTSKPDVSPKPVAKAAAHKEAPSKPPLIELQNKKWVVEYQTNNKNIILANTELKQTVYIYKCTDCLIQIKGKVNSVTLDSCKKTAIVLEDLVSSLEFVNCQSMQGQVTGTVPTISIDKTDGCLVYLSKDSLNAQIVTAKSSEMNVLVPVGNGDYKEFPLPEQFKTTWNGSTMVTVNADI